MIEVTRTMRARRNGRCPLCRRAITVGAPIALLGRSWTHTGCACAYLRRIRANRPRGDS